MIRSKWKGCFVDSLLLKKIIYLKIGKLKYIYTKSRSSTITFDFVDLTIYVYNGISYIPINIIEEMVGHKLGEFSATKKKAIFKKNKKKK